MPNIMLTYRCNLNCPYCFANEFVNKKNTDITLEAFKTAIDFLTKDGPSYVGLIGGEPTIHHEFGNILQIIIKERKIQECTLYTNGLELSPFLDEITTPKFRLLVNCNSPETIGEARFRKLRDNLDKLFFEHYMGDRINLGINYYSDDLDFGYIIELLKRYDLHRVRLSLTVPDFDRCGRISSLEYFRQRKDGLLRLLNVFDENAILPYYDCNKPPFCLWNEEERNWVTAYVKKYKVSESNLVGNQSICYPVIDILPTLEAVRCFGMSSFEKVRLQDFASVTDLAAYFLNRIDSEAYRIADSDECCDCYHRKTRHCTAGCIGFKTDAIKYANAYTDQMRSCSFDPT